MRLQREADGGDDRHRDSAPWRPPARPGAGTEQVRQTGHRHQMLALPEIVAAGQQKQGGQDIQEGPFRRALTRPVPHPRGQEPAVAAKGQNADPQRQHAVQRRPGRQRGGDKIEDEDQRRIDVDQIRIEPLTTQPALGEGQHRRHVVIDRGGHDQW